MKKVGEEQDQDKRFFIYKSHTQRLCSWPYLPLITCQVFTNRICGEEQGKLRNVTMNREATCPGKRGEWDFESEYLLGMRNTNIKVRGKDQRRECF